MFTTLMARSCAVALAVFCAVFQSSAAQYSPGKTYFGRNNYIEYIAGDLPFVISAPHGGREKPGELPDREKGTFAFDTNTQELVRAIEAEFFARSGHHPHVVICRVQRRKLDVNREIVEACAGNKLAEQSYNEYHNFIDAAQNSVIAQYHKGFFIDLHGHGHKDARLELGLAHDAADFSRPAAELNASEFYERSTLRVIARAKKIPYAELLTGPKSFGAMMEREGFLSTPSPSKPVPGTPYFNGGYTVRRHTLARDNFPGLQIESNSKGVRDNDASRKKFAAALFNTVRDYLATHLELTIPRAAGAK